MKTPRTQRTAAFTMVEIAISLAVIGFALVAIIGVLPRGMRVARENREETIINQDAAVFLSAIRNGARGLDDLTNYVYEIRRYTQRYNASTNPVGRPVTSTYTYINSNPAKDFPINTGARIIGLLTWPKYEPVGGAGFDSNAVFAYVRAISGPAAEKPPQTNSEVRADAFSYRLLCENVPVSCYSGDTPYGNRLTNNLRELRLLFRWPVLASGEPGLGFQQFRTQVGGRLWTTNDTYRNPGHLLYFFDPQTFVQPLP